MSMTKGQRAAGFALLLGHGGEPAWIQTTPHEKCLSFAGPCAGRRAGCPARMLAILLNDPDTRAGLPEHGITVAEDVLFVRWFLHDTTTDEITLYDDCPAAAHKDRLAQTRCWLERGGRAGAGGACCAFTGGDSLYNIIWRKA